MYCSETQRRTRLQELATSENLNWKIPKIGKIGPSLNHETMKKPEAMFENSHINFLKKYAKKKNIYIYIRTSFE